MTMLISLAALLSSPSFAQDDASNARAERAHEVYDDCADAREPVFDTAIFRVDGEFVYSSVQEGIGSKIYRIDGDFVYTYAAEGSNDPIYRIDGDFVYTYASSSDDDTDDNGDRIFRIDGEFVYTGR